MREVFGFILECMRISGMIMFGFILWSLLITFVSCVIGRILR